MSIKDISSGTEHKIPEDLKEVLTADPKILKIWESLTPLARNEWICWVISVKQDKIRIEHVQRVAKELSEGKRRPCCWIGCIHRTEKPISPSVRGILMKNKKI